MIVIPNMHQKEVGRVLFRTNCLRNTSCHRNGRYTCRTDQWVDLAACDRTQDFTTAKSWQQSTTLAPYVKLLIDTSRFIQSRIKDGTIVLVDKEIIGNLNFTRNEKK